MIKQVALPTAVKMELQLMNTRSEWAANYESTVNKLAELLKPLPKQKKE